MRAAKAFLKATSGTALLLIWLVALGVILIAPTFAGLAAFGIVGGFAGLIAGVSIAAGVFSATLEWLG